MACSRSMPHHQWHLQVKMKVNTPTPPNPTCNKKLNSPGPFSGASAKTKLDKSNVDAVDSISTNIQAVVQSGIKKNEFLKLCLNSATGIQLESKNLSCTQSPGHERFATENRTAEFHSWYDFEALQRISDTSVRASVMEPMNKIAIIHKLCSFTIRIQQFVQKALRSINSRERKETPFSVKAKEQIEIVLSQQHGPQKFMDLWSKSITIHDHTWQ